VNLQHIKEETCSDCGARVIAEEQKSRHSNGEWFEGRSYECGKVIRYIPDFSRTQESYPCTRAAKYIEEQEKLEAAKDKIMEFAEKELTEVQFKRFKGFRGLWL